MCLQNSISGRHLIKSRYKCLNLKPSLFDRDSLIALATLAYTGLTHGILALGCPIALGS